MIIKPTSNEDEIQNKISNILFKFHFDESRKYTKKQYTEMLLEVKELQEQLNGESKMKKMQTEILIYKLTAPNGWVYIGRTTEENQKQNMVNKTAISKSESNSNIAKAVRKYGIKNFTIEIIDRMFDRELAMKTENMWIKFYQEKGNSLNTRGGSGGCFEHTYKTKLKMRKSNKGKGTKSVCQLSLDGTLLRKFTSVSDASIQTEIPQGNISACCKGLLRKTGGYRWTYDNLNEQQENKLLHLSMNFDINKRDGKNNGNITNIR